MKKFEDPIAVKKSVEGDEPWNFKAPKYDNRSSCFVSAGCDYGLGHKQPVGSENVSNKHAVPQKSKKIDLYEEKTEYTGSHSSY